MSLTQKYCSLYRSVANLLLCFVQPRACNLDMIKVLCSPLLQFQQFDWVDKVLHFTPTHIVEYLKEIVQYFISVQILLVYNQSIGTFLLSSLN